MLQSEFTSVLQANTADALLMDVVTFARRLGFETVDALVVIDHFANESEFFSVGNTSEAFLEAFQDRENWRRDPVMQHCKRSSRPIVWNQDTYTSLGLGDMWEEQACFGYRTGIAVAFHFPEGRHFCIGVDRDPALPANSTEVTRMTAELQLLAAHAQDAALRVLGPPARQLDTLSLTARELESLRWTMEGKTAWELGRILGISEQTAARHINNATQKLGCVNKLQAVLKALRHGLIR